MVETFLISLQNIRTYKIIGKIPAAQGDDYLTGCLLDYSHYKEHYKLIAIDLSTIAIPRCIFIPLNRYRCPKNEPKFLKTSPILFDFKGCVRYIFASLFFTSKREQCCLFHFDSSFHSCDNQILTFQILKCHDVITV